MTTTVEISKLKQQVYVRQEINEDHMLMLACLIDGGTKMPPILITEDNVVVDGRHRVRAHTYLGLDKIQADIVRESGALRLLGLAVKQNLGGSLPINKKDLQHAIESMIDKNYILKQIQAELGQYLPSSTVKAVYANAQWSIRARRVRKAMDLMATTPTLSVADAAKMVGIGENILQAAISKKKPIPPNVINQIKGKIKQKFVQINRGLGQEIRILITRWSEGEFSTEAIDEIMDSYHHQSNNLMNNCEETIRRWSAKRETK